MWIDKAETWALADELGVLDLIRHETLTCYNGVQDGCGQFPTCKLRREGLEKYLEIKAERNDRINEVFSLLYVCVRFLAGYIVSL